MRILLLLVTGGILSLISCQEVSPEKNLIIVKSNKNENLKSYGHIVVAGQSIELKEAYSFQRPSGSVIVRGATENLKFQLIYSKFLKIGDAITIESDGGEPYYTSAKRITKNNQLIIIPEIKMLDLKIIIDYIDSKLDTTSYFKNGELYFK